MLQPDMRNVKVKSFLTSRNEFQYISFCLSPQFAFCFFLLKLRWSKNKSLSIYDLGFQTWPMNCMKDTILQHSLATSVVFLYISIKIAISLLKTLTIAFIFKNIGYFRPIRLTENKTNRKCANYTHNREYELLCQFASGWCQAIKSIASDKVNVTSRLREPSHMGATFF